MNIELLVKQSKFNKDINKIIDTIAPIICDRKITKREIDKANKALADRFGIFSPYTRDDGTTVDSQLYRIWLYKDYLTTIKIYTSDRTIRDGEDGYIYIPEDTRVIYCDTQTGIITTEDIKKYYYNEKYMPTKKQIESAYKKYELLNKKIRELENKKSELPFHYYFNK